MMTPRDFHFHTWPHEYPYRGTARARREPFYPAEVARAIRYENPDPIGVDRIRAVGGRSIHWNAVCLRFAERDFRERSIEGIEEDWPISYQDLAQYYSHVEKNDFAR
jgi:choline dehydrogenase-like flavoprotein